MNALYFDLDGTLIDSARCSVVSTQDAFRKFLDMDVAPEAVVERMGIPIEVIFRELSGGRIHDGNWDEIVTYYRARYKENSSACTQVFAGTIGLLDALRRAGHHLIVVTSKNSQAARHNMTALNIDSYFSHIIGSNDVEHYKPHPDPVYKARATLPGAPLFEMVIGDADTDIMMGKAAGVKTCAVTWGAHPRARLEAAKPDYIAESFDELARVISGAAQQGLEMRVAVECVERAR